MTAAESVKYAEYECARCGRLAQRNELKVFKKWVPVSKTSGSYSSIYRTGTNSLGKTDYVHVGGKTDYQRAHAFVCKRCPGQFRPLRAAFKILFWLAVVAVVGFLLLVLVGLYLNTHGK